MSKLDTDIAEILIQAKHELPDDWLLHDLCKYVNGIKGLFQEIIEEVKSQYDYEDAEENITTVANQFTNDLNKKIEQL